MSKNLHYTLWIFIIFIKYNLLNKLNMCLDIIIIIILNININHNISHSLISYIFSILKIDVKKTKLNNEKFKKIFVFIKYNLLNKW